MRVARTLDLERLHAHPTAAVVVRICREPQLGPWSAGMVALYGLGRTEAGLVGDLGLVQLAGSLWGRRVETYETAALLEPYGEWAGLASMHLLALSGRMNGASTCGSARRISRGRLNDTSSCTDVQLVDARSRRSRANQSTTRRTSDSGALAPLVMPTVLDAVQPGGVDGRLVLDQVGSATPASRATSTRRFEFDELRDPITSTRSTSRTSAFTAACRFEVA